jgi:hypothetical protein
MVLENWVMELYEIVIDDGPEDQQVALLSAAINSLGLPPCQMVTSADPLYLAGGLGGSPYEPAASPYEPAASPFGNRPKTAGNYAFWTQWAFDSKPGGIGLMSVDRSTEPATYERLPVTTGATVRVGVFDTSPFTETEPFTVTWVTPTLTLVLNRPKLYFPWEDLSGEQPHLTPQPPPTNEPLPTGQPQGPTLDDHGLFAASLIHAVAPGSEIHLYRVLDEQRRGDLWTLNLALYDFISEAHVQKADAGRAVLNLSLGGYRLDHATDHLWNLVRGESMIGDSVRDSIKDVASLKTLLATAHCLDMVVVAAAGNDSAYALTDELLLSQIPASFPEVLAVGATNLQGKRACFSNWADVAAPGGEGTESFCSQRTVIPCEETADCHLVGLVVPRSKDDPGYAYWAGTSFAAPLVSGLAALVLEAGGDSISPETVHKRITQCFTQSDGWQIAGAPDKEPPCIISVRETVP